MPYLRLARWILGIMAGVMLSQGTMAQARAFPWFFRNRNTNYEKVQAASQVPLNRLPPTLRAKVARVVEGPTIYTQGPKETFICNPKLYHWFMDHPDRAMVAWRRLGAKCLTIANRGNGTFGWADGYGSDVQWRTIYAGPDMRIWFAEGKVKPGNIFPMIPVQCVVVLRYKVLRNLKNAALLEQKADIFARTDSRAAALVTRLLGPSVPRMAEQGAAQLQMFFAAMAWYCHHHPEKAKKLLKPTESQELPKKDPYSPFEVQEDIFPTLPN